MSSDKNLTTPTDGWGKNKILEDKLFSTNSLGPPLGSLFVGRVSLFATWKRSGGVPGEDFAMENPILRSKMMRNKLQR